jgi:predicted HD superfamily hydrolase involved in NAD metabolism
MKKQTTVNVVGVPATLTLKFAREWVRTRISEKRFRHTEGVAETARELALRSNCDVFLAELGGLLHDCCKEVKDKELITRAKEFGLKLHPIEELNGHLLHGPVAAETVRAELGLTNQEVLNAIAEHTLGAVDMTTLSKVVFLADAIEPGRSKDYVKPIWQALHPCVWPDVDETQECDDGGKHCKEHSHDHGQGHHREPGDERGIEHDKHGNKHHKHGKAQDDAHRSADSIEHSATQRIVYGLEALKLTSAVAPDLDKAVLVACDLGLKDLTESKRYIHPKTVDVRNFYLNLIKNREP